MSEEKSVIEVKTYMSVLGRECVSKEDYDALRAELEAVRELMNCYNLGGWTDAVGPMKRALAAERALENWYRAASPYATPTALKEALTAATGGKS